MTQTLLCIVTSFLMLIAPIFKIEPTPVAPPENLALENEPTTDEMRTYDRVDGVNDSVFYIARPNEKSCRSVNASDFGVSTAADDNYSAFCKAIEYCKANPNITLKVDGGKYYFRTDKAIMLDGLKNVLIDADGAQFIFENPNYFHIVNCNCIEIRGLGITWNLDVSRLASLVKIRNASKESQSFELEFTELNEVSADIPIMAFTKYDSEALTPGTRQDFKENYVYQFPGSIKTVEKTGHNVLKVTHDGSLDNYTDGEVYLLRHHVYGGNAFNVYNTSNITFSGIKLYAVAGMGWLIENRSEHFQLLGCVIGLDPEHDDNRISTTADGVHIANTNGKFRISGCDFSFMGDDDVNVHDNIATITDKLDEKTVEIYTNANNFAAGDTAIFSSKGFDRLGFSAEVTSVEDKKLTFDKELPDYIVKDCIVSNGSIDSGNYVISGNYFHENRARGLLLQSNNGLCENNRFYKIMANPIKVIMDISSGLWLEGTGVNGLVIRNNSFVECNVVEWSAQISISTNIDGKSADSTLFYNITVENNSFDNFYGRLVDASNVSNLKICGNRLNNKDGSYEARRGRIIIRQSCSRVTISNNEYKASVKAPFQRLIEFKNIKSAI
ncbi:MAG: right-handed parallel beta-helix repeat-containing protein [Oscillospiraceae bacterium]|nr:right-handed parallel beta-helix repeat-containing protein [Oscillospiraceae bacterium]